MLLRKILQTLLIICALAIGCTGCSCGNGNAGGENEETAIAEPHRWGFEPDTLMAVDGVVEKGEFFGPLMTKLGMDASEAYSLTMACDSVFDVRKLRLGNAYHAYYSFDADSTRVLEYMVYERDRMTDVVFHCEAPYSVWTSEKPVEVLSKFADVTINSSLWQDMIDAGATPLLILKLSDIYAWTIDFFALQKGDNFKVFYEETLCDGEAIAVDTVRYAVYTHGNASFPVIMYNQGDGGNVYWNEKGESVRKAFLKAPLNYTRVSSGFSYARKHPVTRKVQPHTGVDYAAPAGTPVVAIGDGKVISAKNEGAGGNTVRIRHNSVYTTAYLHLSKYGKGIKAGTMVHQGQVIGYVGSTGRSTGPHLDFRVWKNGTPINPLTMESPPTEPIAEENLPAFLQLADSLALVMEQYVEHEDTGSLVVSGLSEIN